MMPSMFWPWSTTLARAFANRASATSARSRSSRSWPALTTTTSCSLIPFMNSRSRRRSPTSSRFDSRVRTSKTIAPPCRSSMSLIHSSQTLPGPAPASGSYLQPAHSPDAAPRNRVAAARVVLFVEAARENDAGLVLREHETDALNVGRRDLLRLLSWAPRLTPERARIDPVDDYRFAFGGQ